MEQTFVNIVERVLLHVPNIKIFSLTCICRGGNELRRIIALILAILRRHIKHLDLFIVNNRDFVLPRSLLDCTSLKKLCMQFDTPCSFEVPVKNQFPNMKSLSLQGVKILNEISDTNILIFTFPVLKVLYMECIWVQVKSVEIYDLSLDTFTSIGPGKWDDKKELECSIKIIGARLATLNTNGRYPENIVMIGSKVACAYLECMFDCSRLSLGECGLQVRKLLKELSDVRYLSITDVLQAIGQTKLGLPLRRFSNLKRLDLRTPFDGEGLIELLRAAPFLKYLDITMDRDAYDYDLVENLPHCVMHHLEEVTICYTQYVKPKYLVEKFLLKNGAQLKRVFITTLNNFPENEMVEKLSMFPKASPCLEIFGPYTV